MDWGEGVGVLIEHGNASVEKVQCMNMQTKLRK